MAEASPSEDNISSLTAGSEVTFDVVCTPCDNDGDIHEADRYCLDCKEYLCTTCLKYHNKLAGSKHHTLIDTDNVPGTQGSSPVSDVCTQPCQIHKGEVIKYYCPAHKALGCGDCMIRTHDTCKGKLCIPDEAKTLTDSKEFKNVQALIEKLTTSSDNIIKSSNANIKSSAAYRVKALQEIETFRQEVNDALDDLKATFEEQIEEMTRGDEAAMNSVADKASDVQAQMQQMSSEFDTLLGKGQHCQMFIQMKTSEDKLAGLQRQLEEVGTRCMTAFRFKPNEELQKLLKRKDALGELLVKNPKETTAKHVADINVKSSGDELKCWITGATLLSKDKLVINDWNNETVKLVDTELQQVISEFKPEKAPNAVTSINNKQIAVTLPDAKKILIMKSEDALSFEREINVNHACRRIACYDDKLIVSFQDPHEVRILSLAGETLQTFSTSSTGEPLFSSAPRATVSSFTQAIYATEFVENSLTMLLMDGNVIAQYKDDDLKNPTHSAVDDMGMVYVCGAISSNIHLLTPYCNNVKILLAERDGIKWPHSVCYCQDSRRLYVGMTRNNVVKVYQLS